MTEQKTENTDISTTIDVEFDLPLEDWGRVALIAHKRDMTINECINWILEQAVEEAKRLELEEENECV